MILRSISSKFIISLAGWSLELTRNKIFHQEAKGVHSCDNASGILVENVIYGNSKGALVYTRSEATRPVTRGNEVRHGVGGSLFSVV